MPAPTVAPAPAGAPVPAAAPAPAPPKQSPRAAAEASLASTDPERIAAALTELAKTPDASVVGPVSTRARQGLPPALTERAIELLAQTRSSASTPVLLELLLHRRPSVRAAAARALGRLEARKASPQLLALLDDPDATVRAAATEALGACGDRRALQPLFAALDRGVPEAPLAIASLATDREVDALVAHAKDRPLATIEPALRALLARTTFSRSGKLRLLQRVGELGTRSAQDFLRATLDGLDEAGRAAMMPAIDRAMQTARRVESERAAAESAAAGASEPPPTSAPGAAP